jgi:hypothetical protein
MNVNTVVNALKGSGGGPLVLSNPTLLTLFGAPAVLSVPSTAAQGAENGASLSGDALPAKEEWYADARPFRIHACGTIQPLQASKLYSVYLYYGNGLAVTNAGGTGTTQIATVSGAVNAAVPFDTNWELDTICLWDSTSLVLNASVDVNRSFLNATQASAKLTQVANVAAGALQFVIGGISNDSGAGQAVPFQIQLVDFSCEIF